MNRIDPGLFRDCVMSRARALRPDAPELIAIDGKTSRRSHDRGAGKAALHLVSAFASQERPVLGQEAADAKSNEITAIPALLERLAGSGALVTIGAIACNPAIAQSILDGGAGYCLAVKADQPSLLSEIERFFNDAPEAVLGRQADAGKGRGRLGERRCTVSQAAAGWRAHGAFPANTASPSSWPSP
jgi:hypothetical protein